MNNRERLNAIRDGLAESAWEDEADVVVARVVRRYGPIEQLRARFLSPRSRPQNDLAARRAEFERARLRLGGDGGEGERRPRPELLDLTRSQMIAQLQAAPTLTLGFRDLARVSDDELREMLEDLHELEEQGQREQ